VTCFADTLRFQQPDDELGTRELAIRSLRVSVFALGAVELAAAHACDWLRGGGDPLRTTLRMFAAMRGDLSGVLGIGTPSGLLNVIPRALVSCGSSKNYTSYPDALV
jgi:hypothetical protein